MQRRTFLASFAATLAPRLTWADVDYDKDDIAVRVRREMEATFASAAAT